MGIKSGVGLLCLVLAAGAAWWYREALDLSLLSQSAPDALSAASYLPEMLNQSWS